MNYRLLEERDAEAYRELRLEALQDRPQAFSSSYEEEQGKTVEDYATRLGSPFAVTIGCFNHTSKLIGIVSLVKETKRKLQHRANIYAMYVQPEYRRQGVAKNLMKEAIQIAISMKQIEQVYLGVMIDNEAARRLYTSFGFKSFGIDRKAIKIDDVYYDEELMILPI